VTDQWPQDAARWRWPKSARKARMHAVLVACVLWIALIVTFTAGTGNRSIAGPIKGPDFLQFYTSGSLVRTNHTTALYDFNALHRAQVALVPESEPELYPPVYPPQLALLFAPFSLLSYPAALLLWTLITVAIFWLIVRSAWRPVAANLPDSTFVIAAAAAFPPFWNLVLFGQMTIVILAAFWAGWMALERQKPFLAGLAFGLLLIKPQFAIPLAVVVLASRQWTMMLGAVTSIVIQLAVVLLLLGWPVLEAYAAFVPVMLQHADLLEAKPFQSHSLRALTRFAPASIALPLWAVLSAAVLVYVVKVWKTGAPLRVRLGLVMLASVLVNPHLIVYDAAVLALPLIWFGGYVQDRRIHADAVVFWTIVYWLYVTFLAPTAAIIGLQLSVLLMAWLVVLIARVATRKDAADGDTSYVASRASRTVTAALPGT
jgi:Glycosyltransferase family 87